MANNLPNNQAGPNPVPATGPVQGATPGTSTPAPQPVQQPVVLQPAAQQPVQAAPQQPQMQQPVQQPVAQQVSQPQIQQPAVQQPMQTAPQQPQLQRPVQQYQQPIQQAQPQMQQPVQQAPVMQQQPMQRPIAQVPGQPMRPGMPQVPLRPGQQPVRPGVIRKPPNTKRLIFSCVGCSGFAIVLFIIFVLIFVAQTSATGENPIARSLGFDTGSFINTLILLVNLVFGSLSVILFLLTTVGFFRFFMARKDDKEARKRGVSLAGISGLLMIFIVFIWIGIYLFLSSKKVPIQRAQTTIGIVTEPATTLGLTAPITVKFDGTKLPIDPRQYNILSYAWSFGDGETASVPIISHTYTDQGANNGIFDVTLQVAKRNTQSREITTDTYGTTVTITGVKIAALFTASPESGPAPLNVAFDASQSSSPAGQIVNYEWDFDNNNIFTDATGVTTTHSFEQLGTYKVNLRVTDNTGQYSIVTNEITVAAPNIPTAVISIPSTDGKYYTGMQYNFVGENSSSPNGAIKKYEWDFGDGTPVATTRTANHIYKVVGSFNVHLKVTDEKGDTGEATQKIDVTVQESAPIASFTTVPPSADKQSFITGAAPFDVSFDATGSQDPDKNIVDYKWDFNGDGTNDANGPKASYVYKTSGSYNATLTVIDAQNNQSSATMVIKVGDQPLQARITATPVEGVVPLTVTFDASGSTYPAGKIVSYEWDFGDGTPKRIDVSKVIYKYTKIGTFTAKVTAIASDNTRATSETPINIRPVPLTACFEASTETGPVPLTVDFDPRCSMGTIAKYSWDFGDSQSSVTRKPSHTFNTPGSYQVTLEVSDNQNVIDTYNKIILVTGTL